MKTIYSDIIVVEKPRMKVARYAVVSASPEQDAITHMDNWARECGLEAHPGYVKKTFGWDFPFVSKEQREKYGMHGYTYAYVLPDDFVPDCPGAEIAEVEAGRYAKMSIEDPFEPPEERIPQGFKRLLAFATQKEHRLEEKEWGSRYLMEEVREEDGRTLMDIFFPVK